MTPKAADATPVPLASQSWHWVPVLLHARCAMHDRLPAFDERQALRGSRGLRPALRVMGLALGNARRPSRFGA